MQNCLYYTAPEVQEILGVSRGKAYKVISELNEELHKKGFLIIPAKYPKSFFLKKFMECNSRLLCADAPENISGALPERM